MPQFTQVKQLYNRLVNLIFPPKCPFCGKILDNIGICSDCRDSLPWTGDADGVKQIAPGLLCAAPLRYEDAVRSAMLRLKFHDGSGAAEPLGQLAAQCAAERFSGQFDTVSWVPVSRKRLAKRGYDQAYLLAESAGRVWGVRPVRLLRKTTDNPAQSGLDSAEARRSNVKGVYRTCRDVRGLRVLLIDDICTTGSTLREAAEVLLDGGAASVVCASVALTVHHTHKTERNP